VLAATFALPDWSPSGAAPSLLQSVTAAGWYLNGPGMLLGGVWLLTVALCLLVGGYNLARRSLERAGAAFGALAVVLVVGCDAAVVVIFLLLAHDGSLFPFFWNAHDGSLLPQSTTLLTLAGLGIALTGGALALREPK
jgi:hypothetical protein